MSIGRGHAGHQVEGNNFNSDVWLLEHVPGTTFAEPPGDARDHSHLYPQDIATPARPGLNTHRFSVEWARIEPAEGEFSRAVLEHYRRVPATRHEHGLTPVVTFNHFVSPRRLLAAGGWEDQQTPGRFARYCERVTRHLGDLIGVACTFNEANLPVFLEVPGAIPPVEQQRQTPMWVEASHVLGIPPERMAPAQFSATPWTTMSGSPATSRPSA